MTNPRSFPRRTSDARLRPQYEQFERRVLLASDLQPDLKSYSDYEQPAASWFSRIDHQAAQAATIAAGGASTEWFDNFVGPRRYQQHDWIVRLTPSATASLRTLDELSSKLNQSDIEFRVVAGLGLPGLVHVQSLSNSEESVRTSLSHNDRIASFSANEKVGGQLVPNDSSFGNMTNLNNVGQFNATPDADIDAPEAWDRTTGSTKVVVGVIDSGVDAAHPDLYLNMWLNQGEIPSTLRSSLVDTDSDGLFTFYDLNQSVNGSRVRDLNSNGYIDAIDLLEDPLWADGRDTDGNGFVDDFFGWNFRTDSNEPFAPNNPSDNLGHGTHVAGTIGAIGNNGRGITGINWRSSIMALKFLDQSNQGDLASAISAIHYATMMQTQFGANVRVLNNSWGQPGGENALLRDAITESGDAGILFVAAAGNGNILGQGVDNDRVPFYPASYDLPNVIAVAASDPNDRLATFSNYGQRSVDIAAPGVGVLSTLPGGRYGEANGTSMATPQVSGVAALIWSDQMAATPEEVITAIKLGSDSNPAFQGRVASGSRLNASKALNTPVFAPVAVVVSAPNITTVSNEAQEITIHYSHREGIDAQTIGDNDLVVVRGWGPKDSYYPTLKPDSVVPDGNGFRATYVLNALGGNWDTTDYGPYEIQVQRKAVYGTQGLAVREGAVGQFRVQIDDPSIFYVNTTSDTLDANPGDGVALDASGKTSLRAAIMEANAAVTESRTIILDPGFYFLFIAPVPDPSFPFMEPGPGATIPPNPPGWSDERSGDFDIHGNISIFGDDNQTSVIDAQLIDRVFKVHPGATLNLSRVTAQYGRAPTGQDGGAILSAGTLDVSLSTIAYSSTQNKGGAIAAWQGTVNVSQSTIWYNEAQFGGGLFFSNDSLLNIESSTLAFNEAQQGGGAVVSWFGQEGLISNSTISSNRSQGTAAVVSFPLYIGLVVDSTKTNGDGRFVAFSSVSSTLVSGDTNDLEDVFIYDRSNNATERISFSETGGQGNDRSNTPSLSSDGRFVAFASNASNLVPGDTNGFWDIFVHDRQSHTIERVSVSGGGEQGNGWSEAPSISADGRFVTFSSYASNLVPGDSNGFWDVFIYDRHNRTIERVSVSSSGQQADGGNGYPSLSADGRFVAFVSFASNLVTDDTNETYDVFVYDRQSREIERVSVSDGIVQANGASFRPSLSADGRFVAYVSEASNLVPGDSNRANDVFVFDRHNRTTERISANNNGIEGNDYSYSPSLSADGRFVGFTSKASNLVSRDNNNGLDVFVYDRQIRTVERISPDNFEESRVGASSYPALSSDGRYVVFSFQPGEVCGCNPLGELYVYDRQEDSLSREPKTTGKPIWLNHVSLVENEGSDTISGKVKTSNSLFAGNRKPNGAPSDDWGLGSGVESLGFNLVTKAQPSQLMSTDLMVLDANKDLGPLKDNGGPTWTHALLLKSSAIDKANPNATLISDQRGIPRPQDADGLVGAISDIGAYEVYHVAIQGTVFLDQNRNGLRDDRELGLPDWSVYLDDNENEKYDKKESQEFTITDDATTRTINEQGRYRFELLPGKYTVATEIPNGWYPTYAPEVGIKRLPVKMGANADDYYFKNSQNADGRFVAFSTTTQLTKQGQNGGLDVYLYDRQNSTFDCISVSKKNSLSYFPSISADGRFVAFQSEASDLVLDDTNGVSDIFVHDRMSKTNRRISISSSGEQGNGWSGAPSISADGRFVAFESFSDNLLPASSDTNGARDIFVYDLQSSTIERVSISSSGVESDSNSFFPSLSSDGRYVAYESLGSNLVADDMNGMKDIFVHDRRSRTVERISVTDSGEQGNDWSYGPSLSSDGRLIAFTSNASNLVLGDTNQTSDSFVYDRQSRTIERVSAGGVGAQDDGGSGHTSLSADGRFVVYHSIAKNLVPGDGNEYFDVFVYDRLRHTIECFSVSDKGEIGDRGSAFPSISADGKSVAFYSYALNLVPGDSTPSADLFLRLNKRAIRTYSLQAGQIITGIDFGVVPNPGEINGTVFIDVIANGVYEIGEPLREGITVYLDLNLNGRRETTEPTVTTGSDGRYAFRDLDVEMEYVIVAEIPAGFSLVAPSGQTQGTWKVYLPAGATIADRDFGFVPTRTGGQFENGSLSGRIFNDLNGDGIIQVGETGVPNITVYLDLNNNEVRDFNEPRTLTDSGGNYIFGGLGNRAYTVRTILPTGTSQSSPLGSKFAIATLPLTSASTQLANPQDVLAEDLNGDGWSDLAVALYSGNNVSIRLNNGSGGFASSPINVATAPEGLGPIAMASGRLNEGSAFDLITANNLNGTSTILLDFHGTGFASKQTLAVGNQPTDVVLGRFDEDSDTDAIVALKGTNQLVMLVNNGSGSFTKGSPFSSGGNQPTALVSGLFNNDSILDLAVANYGTHPNGSDFGNVAVLLGRGDGTFDTPVPYSVGFGPISIATGDFNSDGYADLVTANFLSNTATALYGSASGVFTVDASPLGVGQGPLQVSVADIEGDGDRDILVTNLLSQSISILRNRRSQGGNGFEPAESFGVAEFQTAPRLAFATADFDRNTTTDIALVNSLSETLRVFSNTLVNGSHRIQSTGVENLTGLNFGTRADVLLPRMTPITNPEAIVEDSPQQVIALSGIAKGREGGPALRITATSSDPVIVPHPTVDYVAGQSTGQLRYTPGENQFGQATITVTLRDAGADQTLDTADDGVLSRMFTVSIKPVNDAPTFTVPRSRNTLEDASAQVISGFVTSISPGPNESMQTLSAFGVTVDKPSLFSAQPAIDPDGTLRFTPALNAAGTAIVTVSLTDNGDTAFGGIKTRTDQLLIILDPVNDAPSITIGGKQSVVAGSPAQSVANFATGFNPGGGTDESNQTIASFVVIADRTELFDVPPTISNARTLTYTPALNRSGKAVVSVQVRDNGGTSNGGVDLSLVKTFEIEVTPNPDTTAPTATITTTEPNPTSRLSFPITIQFSEPVLGFDASDVVLGNATLSSWSEPQPGRFTATLTALSDGVVFVGFSAGVARDAAGNPNASPSPLIHSINSGSATYKPLLTTTERSPSPNKNWTAELDFGRIVSGFEASDLQISNGTATISDLGSGKYRINVTSSVEGDVRVSLPANRVIDVNNRPNGASDPVIVRYVDTTNSDLGDAPAPYPTKIVDNGPFHRRGTLFLGTQIDAELDGQPNINATGDNTNGANDEDGIIFPMTLIVSPTTTTQANYMVTSSGAGRLDAWIDFNGDGDWSDSGERIANALSIPAGRSIQSFTLPAGALAGTSYARFRLSSVGGLNVTGPAVDGEVEDYAVTLVGETGKELALQASELGAHQVSVVGNRILIGNQGAIYGDVPMAQIARLQGIEVGGVVRYDLTGIGGGLPGVVRYPGSTGMVSLVGTAASINISQYGAEKLKGIEAVDLQPSESSTLLVTPADVRAIHGAKRLRVLLNANDSLVTTANWKFSTGRIESGVWIQPYTQGDATLEVVGARPWRNDVFPLDVDGDQLKSPLDVLTLINAINSNAFPGGKLPSKSESSPSAFYDPDGDENLSPLDVLMVINELNRSSGGEGEGALLDRMEKPMTTIAIDQVMTEDMEELFSARRSSPRVGWTRPTKTTTTR